MKLKCIFSGHDWAYMFDNRMRKCNRCGRRESYGSADSKGRCHWSKCSESEFKLREELYTQELFRIARSNRVAEIKDRITNCFDSIRKLDFTSYTVEMLLHYIKQLPIQIYYVRFNDKYNEVDLGEFTYRFRCRCYYERARREWYA